MMPSVAELTYFLEVSKTLNLSKAAQHLDMTQPALSRAIQNLEESVGATLLIRHAKGVKLTPAGQKVLLQINPLLQCWQNTKAQALASHHQVQGQIKLGCHSAVGLFIHGFIAELLATYPALDIELKHATSNEITQAVIDLTIDIGIVTNPIQHPDLIISKMCDTDITLWARTEKRKHLNTNESILICDPDSYHTQEILKKCKSANIKFTRILKVSSIEVIASLVANGCGVGILPACFVTSLYADKLRRLPDAPFIKNDLYLIYRNEYRGIEMFKVIVKKIKEWVKK
jgi:DNA-binding transcriptional LysR family regulator